MSKIFKYVLNAVPRPMLIRFSYLARPFLVLAMRGNAYEDPIDGKRFKRFLPYGYENPRENVLSPSTLSLERHRLLWLYLKNETGFFSQNYKVLHFAPEQPFHGRFKRMRNLDRVTTDLNSPLAQVKADICDLPFADASFDVILCNHVLEHIPDDTKALQELYRVLRPGGWGIFQVPQDITRDKTFTDDSITDRRRRAEIFGQYDHVRVYGMDYFNILRSAGFSVEAVDYTATLTDAEVDRYRLAQGELLPVVRK
ncbi:MAG: methyltransferase domain-containing protein [Bacteroidota bacterium]